MKKILYFAVAALAFVACAKEVAPEITPEEKIEDNTPKVKVSIKAVLAQEPETKATIDMSDGSGSWEKDDEIAVFTHKGDTVILKAETAGASVTFSGEIDEGDAIDDNAVAYYPASIAIPGADNVNKVNLPNSYGSAAAAAKGFLLRGVLTGNAVEFKHIGALLKVTINNIPESVTALEFSAASKAITGQLNVVQEGENPFYCAAGAGSSDNRTITIATTSDERTSSATVFCIPMPVGTYTNGFSIILKAGSTVAATKTSTNNVTISRAKVAKMKAFTPEEASGWFVAGGFNRWSTTATAMTAVEGHEGWLVAKNIDVTPVDGQSAGFKFYNGAWKGSNGAGLHTQYDGANENNSSNITPSNGKYDIYLNPTANKYFIANAGEDWYRTIYLMTDMTLSEKTYYLHIWGHGGGASLTGDAPGVAGTTETMSGIKYYKFNVGIDNSPAGSYDCRLKSSDGTIQYYFDSGSLVLNDTDVQFYASFTSTKFNGDNGENVSVGNSMTMFTNPAEPEGESNWKVLIDPSSYSNMAWEDGVLVGRNISIKPTDEIMFRYYTGSYNVFYVHSGNVNDNTKFDVTYYTGGRSDGDKFKVTTLTEEYICDVYLDIVNKKAEVVPTIAKSSDISLFVGISDNKTPVNLYAWSQSGETVTKYLGDWPGTALTYDKIINGVKYYKVDVSGNTFWNSSIKLIVNDGSWETGTFIPDWSGYKSEYYFDVAGNSIIQLSGEPEAVAVPTIVVGETGGVSFADWEVDNLWIASKDYSNAGSGILSTLKAVSDGTRLYVYHRFDGSKVTLTNWDNYMNLYIDTDYNSTTGDTSDSKWFARGCERDLEYRYYQSGAVRSSFESLYYKVYDNSAWNTANFTDSHVSWAAAIDNSNNIQVEWSVPLADIGVSANSIIRLGFVARTPESTSNGNLLTVRIPAAPSTE